MRSSSFSTAPRPGEKRSLRQFENNTAPDLLHARDAGGNRPIYWAVMTRQLDIIDELPTRGADIKARRQDGTRPIQLTNGDYNLRGWRDVPRDWPETPGQVLAHLRARRIHVDICTACNIGELDLVNE